MTRSYEWELLMTIGEVMTIEPAKPTIVLSAEDYEQLSHLHMGQEADAGSRR